MGQPFNFQSNIKKENLENWIILVSKGLKINKYFHSSGERNGIKNIYVLLKSKLGK